MIERGDHHVIDEPFSGVYYLGPDRVSDRYGLAEPQSTASNVLSSLAAAPQPTFVKDMVHHVPVDRREAVARLGEHTLLTRDPARAIPSFANIWPDVTWEECGYEALVGFADLLDGDDRPYVVVDADDLLRRPSESLERWCEATELEFDAGSLRWEATVVTQWTRWSEFHAGAAASTGFVPRKAGPRPDISDPRVAELVERALPLHQRLVERAATS